MKHLLIISISAFQAVAMMSRKAHQYWSTEHQEQRETYAPKAQESAESLSQEEVIDVSLVPTEEEDVPEVLPDNVVDFQKARIRLLEKRAQQLGVR